MSRRTFASGLAVLHTPPYSRAAFSARLVGLLSLAARHGEITEELESVSWPGPDGAVRRASVRTHVFVERLPA